MVVLIQIGAFIFFMAKSNINRLNKIKNLQQNLKIIDEIEQVRKKNNKNWMDVLRLAYKFSPNESSQIFAKIYKDDRLINKLSNKLTRRLVAQGTLPDVELFKDIRKKNKGIVFQAQQAGEKLFAILSKSKQQKVLYEPMPAAPAAAFNLLHDGSSHITWRPGCGRDGRPPSTAAAAWRRRRAGNAQPGVQAQHHT